MPILNLKNTAGEFEPIPAMIGPQGAQGVPGPNEITTATATPLSGVLVGKDGTVREGVAGEDFAEVNHAHGNITHDGKVGTAAGLPLFTGEGGVVGTKTADAAKIALDVDPRGFEYGGREIPYTWAQIQSKIQAGDFTGLRVGDYKDIILSGSFYDAAAAGNKTMSNLTFRMEIAGIDSYYRYADVVVPHHIDFISRDCYSEALMYNETATNAGSLIESALFVTLNGANGIVKLLPADVAAVTIIKRGLTETKTGAEASGYAWNDMGKLWLPTEREVWGNSVWSEVKRGSGLNIQYPIFRDGIRHIIKGVGHQGSRCNWWCASSAAGSTTNFCYVADYGNSDNVAATGAFLRVPLCFRVA